MGCCVSRDTDDDDPRHGATAGGRPFRRDVRWTAEPPLTRAQLDQQRTAFWETAPSYEGRPEIWQALMAAVTTPDLAMAQSILNAANIIIPTGNLADGCYDELGTRYVIPQYCIVEPTNLRQDPETHATVTNTNTNTNTTMTEEDDDTFKKTPTSSLSPLASQPSPVHVPSGDDTLYPITVRLSTAQDLKVHISKHDETVASLRTRIFMMPESNVTVQTHTLRLIYLGRLLSDDEGIVCEEAVTDESKLGHVIVIPDGAIIQALAAKK